MMTRPALNARRLRAIADEARARLDALEARAESALENCHPGPSPKAVDDARQAWVEAEAAAAAGREVLA